MSDTKRQVLPAGELLGELWIVATPIGNLGDLSPRARDALGRADVILCEDTRRGATLLSALGIAVSGRRLERLDAHTEMRKADFGLALLSQGKNLALITDAGTPALSDPGAVFVAQVREAGVRIVPIPGPSAILALLSVSGFQETPFLFRGYFPRKPNDQKRELEAASSSDLARVSIWFESPQRISKTLKMLADLFPETPAVVGKELTKIYEKIFFGSALQVFDAVSAEMQTEGPRGEWCFAVEFATKKQSRVSNPSSASAAGSEESSNQNWMKALRCLIRAGVSASEAARQVSQEFVTPRKICYSAALALSSKKTTEGG